MTRELTAIHEDLSRDEWAAEGSSDRAFGFIFTVVFLLIGLWPLWVGGRMRIWAVACSVIFLVLTLLRPAALAPLRRRWDAVGRILHRVVNPAIMALLFYGAVMPTAIVLRLRKKDILRLRFDPSAASYWIVRRPPGPAPETMRNQF
jgi:hypothetical protein